MNAKIYLQSRELGGELAHSQPSGLWMIDHRNPRLFSNNLLVPYIFAAWEEYFRATFAALMQTPEERETVLKQCRLSSSQLELIISKQQSPARTIADCFSFQRPSSIDKNFRLIDRKIKIEGALRRPYRSRKASLFESLEELVDTRNAIVHEGWTDLTLFDEQISKVIQDFEEAVSRAYTCLAKHYGFDLRLE